jgi:hypothetical protein
MKTQIFKSIFLFVILDCAFMDFSTAQLIYTDIIPDTTLNANTVYQLDLNNDGTMDFEFSYNYTSSGNCNILAPQVASSYARVTAVNSGFQAANYLYIPAALNLEDTIQSWATPASALLHHGHYTCLGGFDFTGNWNDSTDHYLAVRFTSNGDWYYGWIRMNIHSSTGPWVHISFTLKDYAYDSIPNQQIFFELITGVGKIQSGSNFSIFPNPFSHSATVRFTISKTEKVSLKIFDLNGRLIKTLVDNTFKVGEYQVKWKADAETEGVYFLQMQTVENTSMKKLIVTNP